MTELANINSLPLVLAGPILRRTEPNQVTVWLALKAAKNVTLRIYDQDNVTVLTGTRKTVALGAQLHVVAVTANQPLPSPLLQWGKEYYYNLAFGDSIGNPANHIEENETNTLLGNGILFHFDELKAEINEENKEHNRRLRLSYSNLVAGAPGSGLPSFSMAPQQVADLRLIHASCRKPHGEGVDQLAKLDELINPALRGTTARPHLLFLTGDQIYADDVADQLLDVNMEWSKILLSWPSEENICLEMSECLPNQLKPINKETYEFKVGQREAVMDDHGFTAGAVSHSHLIGLGEFYVMYLMAWSERLWPQELSDFKTLFPDKPLETDVGDGEMEEHPEVTQFNENTDRLKNFCASLPAVRRALANIPCYMMLDDHEITDDWFLHLQWCVDVLGNPFGKRVIQNGMAAYAMFQAWGNTPDQFKSSSGASFLSAIENWRGVMDDENEKTIAKHLGLFRRKGPLPSDETKPGLRLGDLICHRSLDHPPEMEVLDWHYQVEGPGFQVLAMDTRTWRSFPSKGSETDTCNPVEADSIGSEKLKDRREPPVLISRLGLTAQIPTAPPAESKEYLFVVSSCPVYGIGYVEKGKWWGSRESKDYEDWAYQAEGRFEFLLTIENYIHNLNKVPGDEIICVFLTGDIHFGYCRRIELSHELPPIHQRFINLTASALKNETKKLTGTLTSQWLGVAIFTWPREKETLPEKIEDSATGAIAQLEYVFDQGCVGVDPRCFPPTNCAPTPPGPDRTGALKQNECSSRAVQQVQIQDKGREIVGRNNIGEVRFTAGTEHARSVTQVLYWYDHDKYTYDDETPVPLQETHFKITLGFWA